MISAGGPRESLGHQDTGWLVAEAARMGKPLRVRAERGRLVLVLDVGAVYELTADYWSAS